MGILKGKAQRTEQESGRKSKSDIVEKRGRIQKVYRCADVAVLGNDSGVSESETRESVSWRTKNEADMPRNDDDDAVLLARVPDVFPHKQ